MNSPRDMHVNQSNRQQEFARDLLARSRPANPEISAAPEPDRNSIVAENNIIDRTQLAERLRINIRTLNRMVDRGELPEPCLSRGGRPRWLWHYVLEFLEKRHRRLTDLHRRMEAKVQRKTPDPLTEQSGP